MARNFYHSKFWGGEREGAGRPLKSPKQGKAKVVSVSLPESTAAELVRVADKVCLSRSELVTMALDAMLGDFEKSLRPRSK